MSNIEVSNKLLSWVFGCECEFGMIGNNTLHYYYTDKKGFLQPDFENLDTFVRLAKTKAFEYGYNCTPRWDADTPFDTYKDFLFYAEATHPTSCKDYDNYDSIHGKELHEAELEALEWVAEKLEK